MSQVVMTGAEWPTTSVRLIAALRRPEDVLAWERFSDEYGPALFQFCRQRGVQQADTEDIIQTVFIAVYCRVGAYDLSPDRGRFRSWLSTIALRAIWKLRDRGLATRQQLVDPADLDEMTLAQQELLEEINSSVLELALAQVQLEFDAEVWDVFLAIWSHGERPQAIAERSGRSIGWIYSAKFRVLQRLKIVVRRLAYDLDEL